MVELDADAISISIRFPTPRRLRWRTCCKTPKKMVWLAVSVVKFIESICRFRMNNLRCGGSIYDRVHRPLPFVQIVPQITFQSSHCQDHSLMYYIIDISFIPINLPHLDCFSLTACHNGRVWVVTTTTHRIRLLSVVTAVQSQVSTLNAP